MPSSLKPPHPPPPTGLPPLNRVCACYLGHGLMNNRKHTHTHTVFIQTHTYNKFSLYSWLPIVFTVANTFPRQHLNLSLSAGLCLSVSLCVTWQGANLGPYLCLQLCSHSLHHKHLICHRCQSEQIRLPTSGSARPPSSPRPRQPASLHVHYRRSHHASPSLQHLSHILHTHASTHANLINVIIRTINADIFSASLP